ncbi:MAG: hypothetical protein H5T96_05535 [Tissierellales bacterium]|jgi:hypothetical protein|nr:hypothetical protein [Tissierellales bacterium]
MVYLYTAFASAYKELIYKKRYFFNTLFSMIMFYIIFFLIFSGYSLIANRSQLSPLNLGTSLSGIVVSYYAWTMILSIYTSTAYIVQQNQQFGTLENIMVHSKNLSFLLVSENLVNMLFYFVFSWINIFVFSKISNISLYINFFTVMYIIVIGLISVLGISLVMAGISLIYKQINNFMNIMQFLLLGILFLKDTIISRLFLPFYQANKLLQDSFIKNLTFKNFTIHDHLLLNLNAIIFLTIGLIVFKKCLNKAKIKGTLNFY